MWRATLLLCVALVACGYAQVAQYNVVWNSTSADSRGSMPIGNGDIGLNVWAQPDALYFYIGKTDSWDQFGRLLKVGKVRISLDPNPFTGSDFQQVLNLEAGSIQVSAGGIDINLWVDANNPAIYIDVSSTSTFSAQAEIVVWRTAWRQLSGEEASGADGICYTAYESPDTVSDYSATEVVWYHRNDNTSTAWHEAVTMQGMGNFAQNNSDPLFNRTFGGVLSATNMKKVNGTALYGSGANNYNISVVISTSITASVDEWIEGIIGTMKDLSIGDPTAREKYEYLHQQWWGDLWSQSFVVTNGSSFQVGQWYNLQRWMDNTGGGRGVYPIKFNGLIFVTDYYVNNVWTYNADYRAWGPGYWFQNTRFPYWTALANGDFANMEPLFNMYLNALPLLEDRSEIWFGHNGAFFSETLNFWGTFLSGDYGCGYNKVPIWSVSNQWMRYHINGGLELLAMLLAHYAYTGDQATAEKYLLPLAESEMNYFNNHFQNDLNGHKVLTPSQSIETWQEAINPLPDLAGLHWALTQLLNLSFISSSQKSAWSNLLNVLPVIPAGTNGTGASVLLPAEAWLANSLHNSENPELYAIFPFPLYGVGLPNIDIAVNSYWNRRFDCQVGWCQDVLISALLGLVDQTEANLAKRMSYTPEQFGFRFPTFLGKFFDYAPEEDHTSVAQLAIQYMLLQTRGNDILLFAAWPSGWDVHAKLFTAQQTTVEVICVNGKITLLTVTPSSRQSDVQIIGTSCTL